MLETVFRNKDEYRNLTRSSYLASSTDSPYSSDVGIKIVKTQLSPPPLPRQSYYASKISADSGFVSNKSSTTDKSGYKVFSLRTTFESLPGEEEENEEDKQSHIYQ